MIAENKKIKSVIQKYIQEQQLGEQHVYNMTPQDIVQAPFSNISQISCNINVEKATLSLPNSMVEELERATSSTCAATAPARFRRRRQRLQNTSLPCSSEREQQYCPGFCFKFCYRCWGAKNHPCIKDAFCDPLSDTYTSHNFFIDFFIPMWHPLGT